MPCLLEITVFPKRIFTNVILFCFQGNQPGEGNAVFSLGPPEIEEEDEKLKRKTSFKRRMTLCKT